VLKSIRRRKLKNSITLDSMSMFSKAQDDSTQEQLYRPRSQELKKKKKKKTKQKKPYK
jgi:hypothetical protein